MVASLILNTPWPIRHSLGLFASSSSSSSLRRTTREHYTTETQFIDIDEERLMHGVVLAHGRLHSHGAFHEIGLGWFLQPSTLIKDLI
jgi:hypothetical protein